MFPKISEENKTPDGIEALNENNLICRTLKNIKKKIPEILVFCDVALDPYTSTGHDGIVNRKGEIDNDITIDTLSKMSVLLANNGCDIVSPSDMMDGRVKIIRNELEKSKNINTCIMSYSAKLDKTFNVTPEVEVMKEDAVVKKEKPDRLTKDDITRDYEYTRGNLYSIIEKGQEAIDGILELAQDSEMPRAYEVAGQLIKSVSDATDKLMDLQKKLKDVEEESTRKPTTVNNALFVGSTADLAKLLNGYGGSKIT